MAHPGTVHHPVIIAIITPRLGIDSILRRLHRSCQSTVTVLSQPLLISIPPSRGPFSSRPRVPHVRLSPVGSCGYLVLGYCPAGSHILDSRRPPVLCGPNRTSSKFIDTSHSYSHSRSHSHSHYSFLIHFHILITHFPFPFTFSCT